MKKRNREINIFSMSALDLFASAMGAFLLIAVMALPYYLKTDKDLIEQVKTLKKELKETEAKKQEQEEENQKLKRAKEALENKNKKMQQQLSKTFCVINMKWNSSNSQDIDLHIVDPDGNEYYYEKKTYPGEDAFLAVDSKGVTKGAEVWMEKELRPGKYKIYYVFYSGTGSVKVSGSVYTKSFTKDLPVKTLYNPDKTNKILIATIQVDSNGNAILEIEGII